MPRYLGKGRVTPNSIYMIAMTLMYIDIIFIWIPGSLWDNSGLASHSHTGPNLFQQCRP